MKTYSISAELDEAVGGYFLVSIVDENSDEISSRIFGTKSEAEDYVYDMIAVDKIEKASKVDYYN